MLRYNLINSKYSWNIFLYNNFKMQYFGLENIQVIFCQSTESFITAAYHYEVMKIEKLEEHLRLMRTLS